MWMSQVGNPAAFAGIARTRDSQIFTATIPYLGGLFGGGGCPPGGPGWFSFLLGGLMDFQKRGALSPPHPPSPPFSPPH